MWESREIINSAKQIAAEKRLNWVVQKIIDSGDKHFDGLKYHTHMFDNGLEVLSNELGVLYKTKVNEEKHIVTIFHPGPWVDRALAEAQRLEDEQNKKEALEFTSIDF
jgi:hypothetical protein